MTPLRTRRDRDARLLREAARVLHRDVATAGPDALAEGSEALEKARLANAIDARLTLDAARHR